MMRSVWTTLLMLACVLISASCGSAPTSPSAVADMPNPASVFCEKEGGKVEMRQDAAGGVAGVCVFPDGSECDEWAFFRGECKPGQKHKEPAPSATPAGSGSDWQVYRDDEFGYQLSYPANAKIVMNDDPLKGFSILGPEKDGEIWPWISISHPRDRQDYLPPEGSDLLKWLADHNLLGAERKPDGQIAGTTAIHLRHERSPQSYAFDQYYFARGGQLYQITIGHTGDKEDWELYNRFLASIQFKK